MSLEASQWWLQGVGCASSTNATLQDVALVDEFLNATATETVPLFEYLEFEFLLEHEFTNPQISFAASALLLQEYLRARPVTRELQQRLV